MKNLRKAACLCAAAIAAISTPAGAVTFNLINLGGTEAGTQARRGFDMATEYWSSILTSDVTINLEIGYSGLGSGILGQTGSNSNVILNSQAYAGLRATSASSVDALAVASLQTLGASEYGDEMLTVTTNAWAEIGGYIDKNARVLDVAKPVNVALGTNTAVIKALGITNDANGTAIDYSQSDGLVLFSNTFNFDFDPTDGVNPGSYDFLGVAIHEIGHALGFISGV